MHRFPWYVVLGCVVCLAGCGRKAEPVVAPELPGHYFILKAPFGGAWTDHARRILPDAECRPPAELSELLASARAVDGTLLVPDVRDFVLDDWPELVRYLDQGGKTIFLGLDPFAARVRRRDGREQTEEMGRAKAAKDARPVAHFSSVQLWRHLNDSGKLRGRVKLASSSALPWPGVEVTIEGLTGWDAMVLESAPDAMAHAGADAFVFHAHGGEETDRLVVVCRERDDSRWFATVPVRNGWEEVWLSERDLVHLEGGPGRGGGGDTFSVARLADMRIGLDMTLAPVRPGGHRFGLSDIRVAADPRPSTDRDPVPRIIPLSQGRYYPMTAAWVGAPGDGWGTPVGSLLCQSPLFGSPGWAGDGASRGRWIPVFEARGSKGDVLGWPASIYVQPSPGGSLRRWGWVGMPVQGMGFEACREALRETAIRLRSPAFLVRGGLPQVSLQAGDSNQASARWWSEPSLRDDIRVAAEFLGPDGRVIRRVVSTGLGENATNFDSAQLGLGRAPGRRGEAADCVLRLALEDARTEGRVFDEMRQRIQLVPVRESPDRDAWVKTEDGRLFVGHAPIFFTGTAYWPRIAPDPADDEREVHWLDAGQYPLEVVRRDFDRLRQIGMNAVSVDYRRPTQAAQLRSVIEEARAQDIRVHVKLEVRGSANEASIQVEDLLQAVEIRSEPQVYAVEICWQPDGDSEAFGAAWSDWQVEQFGRTTAKRAMPVDSLLRADGDHRLEVAVFRRFLDDYLSRSLGMMRRMIDADGYPQLVTFTVPSQAGAALDPKWDPTSGILHKDLVVLDGAALQVDRAAVLGAGFLSAYARGTGAGKPVLWRGFGTELGVSPGPAELGNQSRVLRNGFDLAIRSGAVGCFTAAYVAANGSDRGLMHTDGTWRESAEVVREYARKMRAPRDRVGPWKGRGVVRDGDARGWLGLWERWAPVYAKDLAGGRIQEVRDQNFGKRTTELEVLAVGGAPYAGAGPLASVNGEWGLVRIGEEAVSRGIGEVVQVEMRARMTAQLFNTGAATWEESSARADRTVWVRAVHEESGRTENLDLPTLSYGRATAVSWVPSFPGGWTLRPWLSSVGFFGEPLQVLAVEPPPEEDVPGE